MLPGSAWPPAVSESRSALLISQERRSERQACLCAAADHSPGAAGPLKVAANSISSVAPLHPHARHRDRRRRPRRPAGWSPIAAAERAVDEQMSVWLSKNSTSAACWRP
jgi:hypothetical protein